MERETTIRQLRDFHHQSGFKPAGGAEEDILDLPDNLLFYLHGLLSNSVQEPPEASPQQWNHFLQCLSHHKVMPLLYSRTRLLPPEFCPPPYVAEVMAKSYLAERLYYKEFSRQLGKVLFALRHRRITPLILKGGALRWMAYPDPALRKCGDIDLLVRENEVEQCTEVLEELGYSSEDNRFRKHKNIICEDVYFPPRDENIGFCVELHWALYRYKNFFSISMDELFENAIEIKTPEFSFYSMNILDLLIHSATHLTLSHNQEVSLFWICDIHNMAGILKAPEQWSMLQSKCSRWNNVMAVIYGLKLACMWTDLSLPEGFEDFNKWPEPAPEDIETWNYSFQRHHNMKARLKLLWSTPASRWEKTRFLIYSVFPSPRIIRRFRPMPHKALSPLGYLKHWWKLIVKL